MLSPLLVAKKILQDASQITDNEALVALVVKRIREALRVDVCSLYLVDSDQQLVLSATDGLSASAVGRIRMSFGEGLVGTVAKRQHQINLLNADQHTKFKYFPETGEERYRGFLGIPMIHHGDVLGVLVVQVQETRRFSEEEEAFLVTMGAHLVGSQAMQAVPRAAGESEPVRRLHGITGAPGVAMAKAWVVRNNIRLEDIADNRGSGVAFEAERIKEAFANTLAALDSDEATHGESETLTALINVYKLLLNSAELHAAIHQGLAAGLSASTALKQAMLAQVAVFDAMEDPYLRARADDLRVLGVRVYQQLQNLAPEVIATDQPVVLVGDNISVEHFTLLDAKLIAGVACNQGSKLSHTSVLASALGIPAVVGLNDSRLRLLHNQQLVVDGNHGQLIVNPPPPVAAEFARLIQQEADRRAHLAHLRDLPATTTDGERVTLLSNTGLLADISPGLERGSEGIGLYRSEIPFMVHNTFPTEEEQLRIYQGVLSAYAPKPVIMRTLDIGGDKPLPYFPIKEENPYLGWRGIRFALDYRNIQLDQIRAMLLANIGNNNLQIMVPMLSQEEEVQAIHQLIDEAIAQLGEEGHSVSKPAVGVMAEVPAIVWMLPRLQPYIDFVSIGSNDLTQYLLAVDRSNPRVAHLYSHFHPSVIGAIADIVRECQRLKLAISVCGEMAADPAAVLLLTGMGVRTLSMSAFKLPVIKWLLRHVSSRDCQDLVTQVSSLSNESTIRARLKEKLVEIGFADEFQ